MPEKTIQAYAWLTLEPMTGNWLMAATYKPYFDAYGCLDDGSSDRIYPNIEPFTGLLERLNQTNRLFESMESYWETDIPGRLPGGTSRSSAQNQLTGLARSVGVELLFNHPKFDAMCAE